MENEGERLQILDMIAKGTINADEAVRLLESLNGDQHLSLDVESEAIDLEQHGAEGEFADRAKADEQEQDSSQEPPLVMDGAPSGSLPPDAEKWRRFWMIPTWIGVGVLAIGGLLMYQALQASATGWFICASIPFILGLLALVLGVQSRTAPWLHLRVQQKPGDRPQHIAFSFPIPIRLTSWLLRTFGHKIPQLEETSVDEILIALGETAKAGAPLFIQVDEGDDGEKVEVYIG